MQDELGEHVPLILDGGECFVGVESTILDLSNEEPCLLRPGAISQQQIEQVLQRRLADPTTNNTRCSGRLESHYAPRAAVEIISAEQIEERLQVWHKLGKRIALLAEKPATFSVGESFIDLPQAPQASARRFICRVARGR